MRKVLPIILACLLLLVSCRQQEEPPTEPPATKTETITLYYGDAGNEKLVTEEKEISYQQENDKYEAALEALIAGPTTQEYTDNIPEGTGVYGTIRQNNKIIVNFTHHFNSFGGSVAEIVAVASVVNTLTDFEGIEEVKILVEGSELIGPSGEPRGFMTRFTTEEGVTETTEEVTLYFAKQDATALVPEKRSITFSADADLSDRLTIILAELILGPKQETLAPTIPEGTKVNSVAVQEGVAVVDFSEEIETRHTGGSAGETMTIASIVNTLTEYEGINLVAITAEGEPLNIGNIVLDAPVQRNEDIIEQ